MTRPGERVWAVLLGAAVLLTAARALLPAELATLGHLAAQGACALGARALLAVPEELPSAVS